MDSDQRNKTDKFDSFAFDRSYNMIRWVGEINHYFYRSGVSINILGVIWWFDPKILKHYPWPRRWCL